MLLEVLVLVALLPRLGWRCPAGAAAGRPGDRGRGLCPAVAGLALALLLALVALALLVLP